MNNVLTFALVLAAGATHAQSLPAGFGWFGSLAGSCWTGQFPDGKTRHTQCYSVQFGKFLRGTAALAVDKGEQYQTQFEGDSVFAWDDTAKRIAYYIWGSDGNHSRLEAFFVGEELAFPVASRKDPSQIAYRSVWRRIDEHSFEVRRERPNANGWTTDLTVLYRRSPTNPPNPAK